jgi:putative aminopeptidase FrvX
MSKEFLKRYINAYSPVAQEWEGQKIWADYLKPFVDEIHSDNYGTVYGIVKSAVQDELEREHNTKQMGINIPKEYKRYKVVIEAHADEISWIITHIDGDGLVYVAKHGGSDAAIAPSKSVLIHTRKNGRVRGVFGFPAIHVRSNTEDKSTPKPENLWIDLGLSNKKAVQEAGVEVGNVVTFEEEFSELGDFYCGKSLDNKIGGYIIAEVAKKLKEAKDTLPFDLYIVNSVQEEVGLLGSLLIANEIKPNVALVHDVCHATDTPKMSKIKNADIKAGNGPTLEYVSQNHRLLLDFIRDVADTSKIKYQLEPGSAGNDTMSFFKAGSVTAIIASPLRYMHTTCELVHKKDVKTAINLFYQCIINMNCRSWKYYEF